MGFSSILTTRDCRGFSSMGFSSMVTTKECMGFSSMGFSSIVTTRDCMGFSIAARWFLPLTCVSLVLLLAGSLGIKFSDCALLKIHKV